MRLLLVEDTLDVADAIVASLGRAGAAVDHAASLADARAALAVADYDVVILDLNLPDGCGQGLLAELRARRDPVPVLVLTARIEVEDRVAALDTGADDYLVKPFDLRELGARVRALGRRRVPDRGGTVPCGDLELDPAARTLRVAGRPVALTRREFSLLEALVANRGRVMAKERLFDRLYAFRDEEIGLNAIELHVARLRRKLGDSRVAIRTLRGLGYQLVADD